MKNPIARGRMYKVSDGGAVRGIRFNKNGTTDVLIVPGKTKKRNPKKKRNAGRYSFRKSKKFMKSRGVYDEMTLRRGKKTKRVPKAKRNRKASKKKK